MLALQSITPERLAAAVPGIALAEARKLVAQVHRGEPVAASSAVRRSSADAGRAVGWVPTLELVAETASQIDPFVKYVLASDGARFETVRIPLEHPDRFCVCVSSQVGCALGCVFCATGRLGLERNLAAWEIVEQVRIVRARLPPSPRWRGADSLRSPSPIWRGADSLGPPRPIDSCAPKARSRGVTKSGPRV